MAHKTATENVTKYTGVAGILLGSVHLRDDGMWQFSDFENGGSSSWHGSREQAEALADRAYDLSEAPRLQLWKVERTSPDYEEMTTAVVAAESALIARLAAVQHFPDQRVAAEFANPKAATVELIGLALDDVVSGSLVFAV